jgi:hypothetical protein
MSRKRFACGSGEVNWTPLIADTVVWASPTYAACFANAAKRSR